jgi:ABC-type proline/glycine betaine transport system permease subunit
MSVFIIFVNSWNIWVFCKIILTYSKQLVLSYHKCHYEKCWGALLTKILQDDVSIVAMGEREKMLDWYQIFILNLTWIKLKVVWAEFSTLSWVVLLWNTKQLCCTFYCHLSLYLCFYFSVWPSACLSVRLSISLCLSLCLSIGLFVSLSASPSVRPAVHLCLFLSTNKKIIFCTLITL